jgi:hypothetical protein
VGIDLGRERVPDATTLLKFRRLLEHELIRSKAPAAVERTNRRVRPGSPTEELDRLINRAK